MSDELFDDIARQPRPVVVDERPVRYATANRAQVTLTATDLESLLPPGHPARLVWHFVDRLDLTALYGAIKAREGGAGRTPIDPKILVALWLYATIDGVGSAREVDRLCDVHDAYRWLRGGVPVNYHTLSDFRRDAHTALDGLLTQSIATLTYRGGVTLTRVAQDGTRVRASAGGRSLRREVTLRAHLKAAERWVAETQAQADGGDASAQAAAQARAAVERLARVEAALRTLPDVAAVKTRNHSTRPPRASTTDPDARVMKMADGGFRPAYNVQLAVDADSDVVVGVAVTNGGNDQHQLGPMLDQILRRAGRLPDTVLADGGYVAHDAIVDATARGVTLLLPVPPVRRGSPEPTPIRPADAPAVVAWKERMQTAEAKTQYRARAGIIERRFADLRRHRGFTHLLVRGLTQVHTIALWMALAQNAMRTMEILPRLMT
jgi:transposase